MKSTTITTPWLMLMDGYNDSLGKNRQLLIGRFNELLGLVPEWVESSLSVCLKYEQTWTSKGSKTRNKVSVGEPA